MKWILPIAILLLTSCGGPEHRDGVIEDTGRNRTIEYRVWLPEGMKADSRYPLILFSHGSGDTYSNHSSFIASLAAEGYVVAAVNHPGNTARDNSDVGVISVWQRPADLSRLLDALLADKELSNLIDKDRIGVAGFSSGGYTAIALAGVVYDKNLMQAYCRSDLSGADCKLAKSAAGVDYSGASASYLDERIKAAFAMAPAVGQAITEASLGQIAVPVTILAARDDELVSAELNATRYAHHIPGATLELLPEGGHFVFMECDFATNIADWFIKDLDLCGEDSAVDREKVGEEVSRKAISFFNETLGRSGA